RRGAAAPPPDHATRRPRLAQPFAARLAPLRDVRRNLAHLGAQTDELFAQDVARLGGARQEHALTPAQHAAQVLHQRLGPVLAGDDLGAHVVLTEGIRGRRTDRRDALAGNARPLEAALAQ